MRTKFSAIPSAATLRGSWWFDGFAHQRPVRVLEKVNSVSSISHFVQRRSALLTRLDGLPSDELFAIPATRTASVLVEGFNARKQLRHAFDTRAYPVTAILGYAGVSTIAELGERGITLRALREGVGTGTATGRAVAAIMAILAELELGRERRASSRDARRARQPPATKPPKLSPECQELLRRLAATGEPVGELAVAVGLGGRRRVGTSVRDVAPVDEFLGRERGECRT